MTSENNSFSQVSDVDMELMEVPYDKSLMPFPMFEIEVKATFIIVERNIGVEGEMFLEAGRIFSRVIHEFPLEDLINDGRSAVLDMLNSMRVPVQPSMVEEIATSAVGLAASARDGDSKVLRMQVEIEAVVDKVPDFGNDQETDNDDDDDDDDNEEDEGAVVTAEEMAEKVRKVVVEWSGKDCPICLEELVVDSEAACMPCSHVFHYLCIATWLKKKKRCPCCRFELS